MNVAFNDPLIEIPSVVDVGQYIPVIVPVALARDGNPAVPFCILKGVLLICTLVLVRSSTVVPATPIPSLSEAICHKPRLS